MDFTLDEMRRRPIPWPSGFVGSWSPMDCNEMYVHFCILSFPFADDEIFFWRWSQKYRFWLPWTSEIDLKCSRVLRSFSGVSQFFICILLKRHYTHYTGSTMTTVDYMVYWTQFSLQDWKGVRHVLLLSSSSGALVLVGWLAKKNFSISKLQSNILTLTDWPPFVNVGTPRRDMREAIRPGQAAPECVCPFPSSGGFLLLLLLLLSKHHCGTNRIPQSIHWRTLLCSIETCVTEGSGFRLRPSCYTSIIIPLWDWLTDEMDDERI